MANQSLDDEEEEMKVWGKGGGGQAINSHIFSSWLVLWGSFRLRVARPKADHRRVEWWSVAAAAYSSRSFTILL